MKRTLLFVLALIAVGCADTEQAETPSEGSAQVTPSVSCADISEESPLEDLRPCAEQGYADAQTNLAVRYMTGDGVPFDPVLASMWINLAKGEQGESPASSEASRPSPAQSGSQRDARWAHPPVNVREVRRNETGDLVADTLTWLVELRGERLTVSLQTDLPDETEAIVTVGRSYQEVGSSELYSITYFSESSLIRDFRAPRNIRIRNSEWQRELAEVRRLMAQMGEPFTVAEISDSISVGITIPINQDAPIYLERNSNVVGRIWKEGPIGRTARTVLEVAFPIDASEVNATEWADPMNLTVGGTFSVSRDTPITPSPDPDDPIAALAEIGYLTAGGSFLVVEKVESEGTWYFVRIGEAEGWINVIALFGQEIVGR